MREVLGGKWEVLGIPELVVPFALKLWGDDTGLVFVVEIVKVIVSECFTISSPY